MYLYSWSNVIFQHINFQKKKNFDFKIMVKINDIAQY